MFKRIATTMAATLLAGCVYYPPTTYVADPQGDYYYEPRYDDGYHGYVGVGYGYGYGYGWWPSYWYGAWPWYSWWYPGYGYYYGVTWCPTWGHGWDHWGGYHAYSPYRNSYYDNYYGWRGDGSDGPRFGSASNEAERLANMERSAPGGASLRGGGYGAGEPMAAPRWSRGRDDGRYGTTYQGGGAPYPDVRTEGDYPRRYPGDVGGYGGNAPAAPAGNWSRGRDTGGGAMPGGYSRGPAPGPQSYAPARGGGNYDRGGSYDRGGGNFNRGGAPARSAPPRDFSPPAGRSRDPDPE
ncbi:MAG TPA: hypothetical protein VFL14_12180 [Xanthomonadales bacterium]|nr:hypothetical protein [Xanthomonadales bacterium]